MKTSKPSIIAGHQQRAMVLTSLMLLSSSMILSGCVSTDNLRTAAVVTLIVESIDSPDRIFPSSSGSIDLKSNEECMRKYISHSRAELCVAFWRTEDANCDATIRERINALGGDIMQATCKGG